MLQKDPSLEKTLLRGHLTRPNILYLQSTLFMATRSPQKAIQSLTAALNIDPNCVRAKAARASLWANLKAVDDATIVKEYQALGNSRVTRSWTSFTAAQFGDGQVFR